MKVRHLKNEVTKSHTLAEFRRVGVQGFGASVYRQRCVETDFRLEAMLGQHVILNGGLHSLLRFLSHSGSLMLADYAAILASFAWEPVANGANVIVVERLPVRQAQMIKHFRVTSMLRTRLEESGIDTPAVLRNAGLPRDLLEQSRILVTTEQLFALWRAIGEVSGDPGIGLKLGTETKTERFHPMGIAALSTAHFGAAIEHMARYKRLSAPEEILHDLDEEEWSIQFRWTLAMDVEPAVLIEHCFAWVVTIARHGSRTRVAPLRVELVQPRTHLKAMERFFGCPVLCGKTRNAMVFRACDATLPFVTRNAELLEMLAPQFEQELKQRTSTDDSFLELVRGAIQHKLTGHRPTIDDVARDLHMSSRTLQRRLQESGSGFQRVLDEARHEMARYYLRNSVLELAEAAYLLGYEDANSFARAFRAWEGVPPTHWREINRSTAVN